MNKDEITAVKDPRLKPWACRHAALGGSRQSSRCAPPSSKGEGFRAPWVFVEKQLLWKLYKLGAWGTRHTSESNLQKSFPPHLRGKTLIEIAEGLRKTGLLAKHATHHEFQWHLNWNKKNEIEELIKNFLQMKV